MFSVLITGANRGLGLEMVKQYADAGWQVYACCRNPKEAEMLLDVKKLHKKSIEIYQLDVTNEVDINRLSDSLKHENIDILLNNAGVWGPVNTGLGNIDVSSWLSVFRTNTISPFLITTAFTEQVARSELKIVATISSIMGSITSNTDGGKYIYRSSKAALNAVFKSLSIDLKNRGITVVMLHPGWVKTDMGGSSAPLEPQESVNGLRNILESVTLENTGTFIAYDASEVQW